MRCFANLLVFVVIAGAISPVRCDEPVVSLPDEPIRNTISLKMPPSWKQIDKMKHMTSGFMLVMTSGYYLRQREDGALIPSLGISLGIGVLKEARDYCAEEGVFSWGDLVADAVGVIAGGVVLHQVSK
ncbi:MAG: hypothetical protein K9N46_03230 [Candidatus Marinimicrobia bacterium]|nr:hypothetical protein [Candidatus Neomarinimicrobiota bacterium]MCF7828089.1 hypothetical protein [Candidatus Neomarinimicrobiota bacterium]MCF7879736.1 hypothetical protein [Candidatus Neomarinimicrobiota bacterium]